MVVRRVIAPLGAALLLLVSCKGPEPEKPAVQPVLTASVSKLDAAAGSVFLSVTAGGDWSLSSSESWATVSPATGSGSRNSVILSYEANTGKEERSVTLTLTASPGGQAVLPITQKASPTPHGESPEYGYGYDTAAPHWLELPATTAGDGREWFAHNMEGGDYFSSGGARNWSFYYDYASYLSVWVAYPLNNGLRGSGSRTDSWGYDPLLPMDSQQSITSRFEATRRYYSDEVFDRGHQLPSADRLGYAANVTTFYPTNMTPQRNSFNGGIWADLETRVRSYASSSDTLYVVTGCVIDGASGSVNDRAGHTVRVPSAYFKALLRYKTGSTYGDYMACGYLLPHDNGIAGGDYREYIMSIDELEKKTGITFFVNLAEKVGADEARKIKSQEPVSWWK